MKANKAEEDKFNGLLLKEGCCLFPGFLEGIEKGTEERLCLHGLKGF